MVPTGNGTSVFGTTVVVVGDSMATTITVGTIDTPLIGNGVGFDVCVLTGGVVVIDVTSGANVVSVAIGNDVGGGMTVPNGDDVGACTTPPLSLLSIHNPSISKPTQSPINRFEQSK